MSMKSVRSPEGRTIGGKWRGRLAADFLSLVFGGLKRELVMVASGCGKVGNLPLVFHFPMTAKLGCGNVEISRLLRDFQGTVGGVGKLLLLFLAFHGPGISTASGSVIGTAAVLKMGLCIVAATG